MIFKLISKDKNSYLPEVTNKTRAAFHVNGIFLYFRGVKVGICNYPTIFKDEILFIERDEIIETYEFNNKSQYFKYDINDKFLRIYDAEKTAPDKLKFKKIVEINDGIILENKSVRFIDLNGKESELSNNFVIDDNIILYSFSFIMYKKQMSLVPLISKINLVYNIIIPEIIIKNNLYSILNNEEPNPDNLFTSLPSNEYYLSEIKDNNLILEYNSTGRLLLFINNIFLCCDTVTIKSIILASSFNIEDKLLKIIVTNSEVFMMYEKFICYFHHKEIIYHINQSYNEIPSLSSLTGNIRLARMYFTLTLFSDLPILFNEDLESFIFDLFIYTNLGKIFLDKIYKTKGWFAGIEDILCNIYRVVDDKNKEIINEYICKNKIENTLNLKKIIIFHHDLIPSYIERCIKEYKEFEIEELIEHFRNSDVLSVISMELLRYNCFYLFTLCYPEYEEYFDKNLLKIEKYNLISQKNKSKSGP